MANLTSLIKQAALEAVDARKPAEVVVGSVTSVAPLKVRVSDYLTLDSEFLLVPEQLVEHTVVLAAGGAEAAYTVRGRLAAGDRVALVKNAGGQKYLIIDKVVST